jgi:hypothetical protein
MLLLIARYYYLMTYGVPHRYGRTAWIYWPTQISIALTAALMMTQVVSFLFESTATKGDNKDPVAPLVYVLGCLGMGLAWVSRYLSCELRSRGLSFACEAKKF